MTIMTHDWGRHTYEHAEDHPVRTYCMYVCMYAHTYIQYVRTVHTYSMCVHTYIHTYVRTYILYVHTYVHTYVRMYVCTYDMITTIILIRH